MKVAIVADWLPTYGGAEHVISALHSLWPSAPIHTTVAKREALPSGLREADIRTDPYLQCAFRIFGRHQILLPWMPKAMERVDCKGADIVLSSSHAVGKGIIPAQGCVHVCYCHTPMRYAWEMESQYLKDFHIRWPLKTYVKAQLKRLRRWDLSTAKRVDHFIANSTETQRRIRRIYGRDSTVIPPPVEAQFFTYQLHSPSVAKHGYFLALGRMVPYKRFDLLVELASTLHLPLKIAGTGGELAKLKACAGPTVEFLGYVPDERLPELYAGAKALLFPQSEDAGIVPMEAQAMGIPVIAFGEGGVTDVVLDGKTGVFASEQTVESFTDALARFSTMTFHPESIRTHARQFHIDAFLSRISDEVASAYEASRHP